MKQEQNKAVSIACQRWLTTNGVSWQSHVSQDDMCSGHAMLEASKRLLSESYYNELCRYTEAAKSAVLSMTAWRIEGTLREYPKFPAVNAWFDYPIHRIDDVGTLKDISSEDGFTSRGSPWKKNLGRKKTDEERKSDRENALETAFEACGIGEKVTVSDLAEYMGKSKKTVERYIKEHGGFWLDGDEVGEK